MSEFFNKNIQNESDLINKTGSQHSWKIEVYIVQAKIEANWEIGI